jgi:hypothetical protein
MYHEGEHAMANQARGHGLATNEEYDRLRYEHRGRSRPIDNDRENIPLRSELVQRLASANEYLKEKYGLKSAYFQPEMLKFQGGRAPNLLAEQLADLSALQQSKRVDIINDPYMQKMVFTTPQVRETVDALMGLRQTRLDAKDLAPYTPMSQQPVRGALSFPESAIKAFKGALGL